jgi:hypothetical protein
MGVVSKHRVTLEDVYNLVSQQCDLLGVEFELDAEDNPDTMGFFDADGRRLVLRTSYRHHRSGQWKKIAKMDKIMTAFHELRHAMQWAGNDPNWVSTTELPSGEEINCADLYDNFENGEAFYTIPYRRLGAQALANLEEDADRYAYQMMEVYGIRCNKATRVWTTNRILYSYHLCAETGINLARSQLVRLIPRDMQEHIGVDPGQVERMLSEIADNLAYYRRYSLGYWKTPTQYVNNGK